MVSKPTITALGAVLLSLGLSACGKHDAASNVSTAQVPTMPPLGTTGTQKPSVPAPTLAQGPDVCFRAIAKQLGANTKVSEITSFFSAGSEIDSSDAKPKGELTSCEVQYQSPTDPRKLVGTSMDIATGEFAPPGPVEITVAGGDASKFKLDDYLIPLSQVNAAGLTSIMDAQKAKLAVYSRYAWTGVRLSAPDGFSATHTLRLDVTGRLASNDIKSSGYAAITTDAKTVKTNFLTP